MSSTIAQSDRHGIEAQTTAVERGHTPTTCSTFVHSHGRADHSRSDRLQSPPL